MSWVQHLGGKRGWMCDHCERVDWESEPPSAFVRKPPSLDPDSNRAYVCWVWDKAYPRGRFISVILYGYRERHYCSDECVEPHDLEEIRLALDLEHALHPRS